MGRVIQARDLRYVHPDGSVGVDGVDLAIDEGERVAVLGANGSGKSTLQLLLGGLLDPTDGHVEYFGGERDVERVRDRLAVLLQDPDDYLFHATVREDLAYGPSQLGMDRERADARIERLADELDLTGLLSKPPFRLSGGERKRAALAAALSYNPEVLLLDEPTASLDGPRRDDVLELVDELREARDLTVVTFTPDVELVPEVADRVVLLGRDGTIAADGEVTEILTDVGSLSANGLCAPATVRLFDGLVESPPLDVEGARRLLRTRYPSPGDAGASVEQGGHWNG